VNRQDAEDAEVAKHWGRVEPSTELDDLAYATVEGIAPIHVAQILSYLKATRLRLGLLISFNVTTLRRGIKRVIPAP
jgi:hypothetical protein